MTAVLLIMGSMCGVSVGGSEYAAVGRTNCHLYHYAGNNPVRYVDPDGKLQREGDDQLKREDIGFDEDIIRKDGEEISRKMVNLFTDDGTPVLAWENFSPKLPDYNTNCHGYTFADGKFWIEDAQTIIEHDGYQKVSIPQKGDVVVYYDSHGTAVHSATVIKVEERKNRFMRWWLGEFKITVIGLSGTGTKPEETPVDKATWGVLRWKNSIFYRKK